MRALCRRINYLSMNPGVMTMANRSFAFHLYDFNLEGISAKELAYAHSLSTHWVEERIEAVRLCLKFQARATIATEAEQLIAAEIGFCGDSAVEPSQSRPSILRIP
jgi:hypothetical protein